MIGLAGPETELQAWQGRGESLAVNLGMETKVRQIYTPKRGGGGFAPGFEVNRDRPTPYSSIKFATGMCVCVCVCVRVVVCVASQTRTIESSRAGAYTFLWLASCRARLHALKLRSARHLITSTQGCWLATLEITMYSYQATEPYRECDIIPHKRPGATQRRVEIVVDRGHSQFSPWRLSISPSVRHWKLELQLSLPGKRLVTASFPPKSVLRGL